MKILRQNIGVLKVFRQIFSHTLGERSYKNALFFFSALFNFSYDIVYLALRGAHENFRI